MFHHRFPEGFQVIVHPSKGASVVALQVWVNTGSAAEQQLERGLAHTLEHMLFKGTAKRGMGIIAEEIEAHGGDINAFTTFDQTVYHVTMAQEFWKVGLDVLLDAIQHPVFPPQELEKEKAVILEEIRRSEDIPQHVASEVLFKISFGKHPYSYPIAGTLSDVTRIQRNRLKAFYSRWYQPQNMFLVAAGDLNPNEVCREIQKRWTLRRQHKDQQRVPHQETSQRRQQQEIVYREVQEEQIVLGFVIPPVTHQEIPAIDVLTSILGQGNSSRLYQRLREKEGIVTDIHAWNFTPRNSGLMMINAAYAPLEKGNVCRLLSEEIALVRKTPPSQEELEIAKNNIVADRIYNKQTVDGMASAVGFSLSNTGDCHFEERYYTAIQKISAADVRQAAEKYMQGHLLNTVLLTRRLLKGDQKASIPLFRLDKKAPQKRKSMPIHRFKLPGGGVLLLKESHQVPLVHIRSALLSGSRVEPSTKAGLAMLTAKMLTKGTALRNSLKISKEIDSMSATLEGFVDHHTLGLALEVPSQYLSPAISLYFDILTSPQFPDDVLTKEKKMTLEEINGAQDNPNYLISELFWKTLYPHHPYGTPLLGTKQAVKKISREELIQFYRSHLSQRNMALVMVGDFSVELLKDQIMESVHQIPQHLVKMPRFNEPVAQAVTVHKEKQMEQSHVLLGFLGPKIHSPERHALRILSTILSAQGGRLYRRLREESALVYNVHTTTFEGIEKGFFGVYFSCSPEKVDAALALLKEELNLLKQKEIPPHELERVKTFLMGRHAMDLQRYGAQAGSYLYDEIYGLGFEETEKFPSHLQRITSRDIRKLSQSLLKWDDKTLATIGPRKKINSKN